MVCGAADACTTVCWSGDCWTVDCGTSEFCTAGCCSEDACTGDICSVDDCAAGCCPNSLTALLRTELRMRVTPKTKSSATTATQAIPEPASISLRSTFAPFQATSSSGGVHFS